MIQKYIKFILILLTLISTYILPFLSQKEFNATFWNKEKISLIPKEVISAEKEILEVNKITESINLQSTTSTQQNYFESEVYKSDFPFNAIAPIWKAKGNIEYLTISLRVWSDNKNWSAWLEVDAEKPIKDGSDDRLFPETPIFIDGNYFQFRTELSREINSGFITLTDLKIAYQNYKSKSQIQKTSSTLPKANARSSENVNNII